MGSHLSGEGYVPEGLTCSGQEVRRRGRPEAISDTELRAAYADLVFVLSTSWAAVGWDLQQATEIPQLRHTLRGITGINCSRLDPFLREECSPGTARDVVQLSAKIRTLSELIYRSHEKQRECERLVNQATCAMTAARTQMDMEEIRPLAEASRTKLDEANNVLNTQSACLTELHTRLRCVGSHFAQHQLLDFILSRRRSLTPRNFAAAMAGLPFVGWRQSSQRCAEFWKSYPESFSYRMFLLLAQLCGEAPNGPGPLIEDVREHICAPGREDDNICKQFRDNWYFLEAAVRSGFDLPVPAPGALPFRIFAEYHRRWSCQSARDVLLNESSRL